MSLRTFEQIIEADYAKVKVWLGDEEAELALRLPWIEKIVSALNTALKSKIADGFLATILPAPVIAELPGIEAILGKLATDLSIGSAIESDVAAATTVESKLTILLTDLQKYNLLVQHAYLNKIASTLLAAFNNNKLTEAAYDTYTQIHYLLAGLAS